MIHVSDAFKEAWLNGNQKEILLNFSDGSTLTNDDVVSESFSLVQSVCEEEQITFGLTSSAQVSVQIYNSGKQYKGLTMSVTLIAGEYPMQIGVFKIDDDVRSDDRIYRTLTGYDALKDVLNNDYSAWHNALSSMTLKQYRDAFFSHIGISQVSTNLLNDGLTINIKTVQSLSGAEIIRYICEPNACFGFINNLGNFQYTEPIGLGKHYPADDLYPSNDIYPGDGIDVVMTAQDDELAPIMGGVVCSDYNTHRITQVRFNYSENTPEVTYGVPGNRYELTSNVLMYGQSESTLLGVLQNFMSNVEGFFYTPGRLSGRARVWAQLGDIVGAAVKDMSVAFPILRRSMKGITALYDEYEARGKEYYTYSANTYERRITDAETASYEQAGQIDDINETVGNLEIHLNRTDEGLVAEVSRATGAESGLSSRISVTETEISTEVTNRQNADAALQSSITQTADSINLEVSKKVDINGEGSNTVVSQINLSPETITLSTGRLIIDSGNFQLDKDGYATAKGITLEDGIYISDGSNLYFDNSPFISLEAYGAYGQFGVICNGEWSLPSGTTVGGNDVLTTKSTVSTARRIDAEDGSKVFSQYNDLQLNASDSVVINTSSGGQTSPGTAGFHCYKRPFFEGARTSDNAVNGRIGGDDNELVKSTQSSMRWKNSISEDITTDYLDPHRLYDLKVKQFKFNTDYLGIEDRHYNKEVIGFIAEEVDSVYPIACDYDSFNMPENWNVRYMIPPMLKLIQEQHEKIEELENRIKILEEER